MIEKYLDAAFTFLWIETVEPYRAERIMQEDAKKSPLPEGNKERTVYHWDLENGLYPINKEKTNDNSNITDPVKLIHEINNLPAGSIVIAWNLHFFLKDPGVIQAIQNNVNVWKGFPKHLIILSPMFICPVELEKLCTLIDLPLPEATDFNLIIEHLIEEKGVKTPKEKILNELVEAGKGLTEGEFEDAVALSLTLHKGKYVPDVVREQKTQLVKKSEILSYYLPREYDNFSYVGGMDELKDFCITTLKSTLYKGILILGHPGGGKSAFAKALGKEVGLPTLLMDFENIQDKYVGESEKRIKNSLKVIDAVGKCILFVDEIEKGLAGVGGDGSLSSNEITVKVGSTFLKWQQNRKEGEAYLIATCNDIEKLPPPYLRLERWDRIFFVDLPNVVERNLIWKIWGKYFNINISERPEDIGWSGAEIRTCCRLSVMLQKPIAEVGKDIIPLSRTMHEKITNLREWASNRAVRASKKTTEAEIEKVYRKMNLDNFLTIKEHKEE